MALSDHDLQRLRAALGLARRGRFDVEPNPAVGCVIEAADGGVVGEGYHAAYGGPHAEIAALDEAGAAARGGTAYVSLAPCGRHGKTAPCSDALLAAGVRRVVFAAGDPDPEEQGAGLERLRAAGVDVEGPVSDLAAESEALLCRFRQALTRPRPWTFCKWTMSADGRIAARRGSGGMLSGAESQRVTHLWRAYIDAIAVGVETILADDPQLTCRLAEGLPAGRGQPHRIVFDTQLRTPPQARLLGEAEASPVWILAGEGADAGRRQALEAAGARVLEGARADGHLDLAAAWERLHTEGVGRLLVEGGARIHGALFRAGLVDQVGAFVAPRILGGAEAVSAVVDSGFTDLATAPALEEATWRACGDDMLLLGYVSSAR